MGCTGDSSDKSVVNVLCCMSFEVYFLILNHVNSLFILKDSNKILNTSMTVLTEGIGNLYYSDSATRVRPDYLMKFWSKMKCQSVHVILMSRIQHGR